MKLIHMQWNDRSKAIVLNWLNSMHESGRGACAGERVAGGSACERRPSLLAPHIVTSMSARDNENENENENENDCEA